MSIKRKVQKNNSEERFVKKIENTLFDMIDTDDPVHLYMHTDICKVLQQTEASIKISDKYTSGEYHLKQLSKGDFQKTLEVTEALYETCIRFEKPELALIVSSEVIRALLQCKVPLNWIDGKFIPKEDTDTMASE
ncbi:hypothetical protein GCM10027037_27090 [Mucilaginibacter koreensis]